MQLAQGGSQVQRNAEVGAHKTRTRKPAWFNVNGAKVVAKNDLNKTLKKHFKSKK